MSMVALVATVRVFLTVGCWTGEAVALVMGPVAHSGALGGARMGV